MAKRWCCVMLMLAGLCPLAWGLNSATVTITGSEQQVSGSWDQNSVTVAFNGFQETVAYGEFSSSASVASELAGKFSNDYLSQGLCAVASGSEITFKLQGTATFGTLYVGGSTTSFQVGTPTGFLSEATKADSGTMTLTVNGVTAATTSYGEGSTPETIADGLAGGIQPGSPVSISADDDTIALTSTASGSNTNYSYSVTTTYDTTDFTQPSFSASPSSGTLQGGADANTTGGQVYSYCMPSSTNPNCTSTTANGYDADGNVTAVIDSVMGTWAYSYDTLSRLALAADNEPNNFTNYCWSYDAWGNRTQQYEANTAFPSGAGGPSICNSLQPSTSYNANNQMTNSPTGVPVYDASGDITTGTDGNQYLYDAEGRICAESSGSYDGIASMVGYVYDASGNRVAKGPITKWSCDPTTNGFEGSGQESDYILNQSGQPVTKTTMDASGAMTWDYTNVYADGQLFATYDAQGLHFQLNDWLGTRRVTTDYAGVIEQTCASLPYGDQLTCTGSPYSPNEQHFTGKIHDQESGLDYFDARYYAENNASFLTPDPAPPTPLHLLNPQRWNKYSYALNSPLVLDDPTGMDAAAVNFSGMVMGFGHEGIVSINPDGTAEYARFGPAQQTIGGGWGLDEPGLVQTSTALPTIQFGANGLPTDASMTALKNKLADLEHVSPSTVRINYFKTTPQETANLNSWIKQQQANSGNYKFCTRNCANFTARGLVAGGAITQSQANNLSIDPNLMFDELEMLAPENSDSSGTAKVTASECDKKPNGTESCYQD